MAPHATSVDSGGGDAQYSLSNGSPISTRDASPTDTASTTTNPSTTTNTAAISQLTTSPQKLAVVGMACRLPGSVTSPEELWELCARSRDGWSPIPADRFSSAAFLHPNPSKGGTTNARGGYFLNEDIKLFDAPFFNVTEKEAISMDPQQRLLLECSFEAIENAGVPKESLIGSDCAVFIGGSFADYEMNNCRDTMSAPSFQATGCAGTMLSNRLSYYFDLHGPSATIDTACSSSLTALHMAAQSLRNGECSQAIVGGCHLNLLPDYFVAMSMSQLLSDEGRTCAFDERAKSGFSRGEGVGVVMLKPLEHAIRDNDTIRAVIVNTGIGQDGRTNGITAPNDVAQQQLMQRVYSNANINPSDCAFVEAHGTGTKVGDPIEVSAINQVFGAGRSARSPLYIGSLKANIGHLEGASGIASIIKACLMLERGLLLPNVNFSNANPNIPLAAWNIRVPTSVKPWPRGKKYVSVSNYGFGGAIAHTVLEKAPNPSRQAGDQIDDITLEDAGKCKLFVISGNDAEAVKLKMRDLGIYLEQRPEVFEKALSGRLAYTLGSRRSHLLCRIAFVAESSDQLGVLMASTKLKPTRARQEPCIGFVFTGQGAQWAGMGKELMQSYPVFRSAMETADAYLRKLGAPYSLIEELGRDQKDSIIDVPYISQPACTATQIALVTLLRAWNIKPRAVVGHSSGEIGAAYAAGMLTMEHALALAFHRGRATVSLKEQYPELQGRMLAVGCSRDAIQPFLETLRNGYAVIACINSPSSITVSGEKEAIEELQHALEAQKIFARMLRVDVAYHSGHMSKVAKEYRNAIQHIVPTASTSVTMYSSLYGRTVVAKQLDAEYWVANLVSPVEFDSAAEALCRSSSSAPNKSELDILVEIGPHGALEGPLKDILKTIGGPATKITYSSALSRNKNATETMLQLAVSLYMKGSLLDFAAINFPISASLPLPLLTDLPKYPWTHTKKYWHDSRISDNHKFKKFARHDILGVLADYSNDLEPTWRNIIRVDDIPWLRHHKMQSKIVFPMAGYLAMAMEAASQRAELRNVNFDRFDIREVVTSRALILDDCDVETTITLRPFCEGTRSYSDIWDEFRISSWITGIGWSEHCRGLIATRNGNMANSVDGAERLDNVKAQLARSMSEIDALCNVNVDSKNMYDTLSECGAIYGPTFQGLVNCVASNHCARAELVVPDTRSTMPYNYETHMELHPATFDDYIQIVWPILGAGRTGLDILYMPSSLSKATILRKIPNLPGARLRVYGSGRPTPQAPKPTKFTLTATTMDEPHEAIIHFEDLVMTPILDSSYSSLADARQLCFKLDWQALIEHSLSPTLEADMTSDVIAANGRSEEEPVPSSSDLNGAHVDTALADLDCEFAIINDTDAELFAASLTAELESAGAKSVTTGTLSMNLEGKVCIMLHELNSPRLSAVSAGDFEKIQAATQTAAGILWVVREAYQSSTTPDSNMVVGLARTIRSETSMAFATLDLGPATSGATKTDMHSILTVIKKVWGPKATSSGIDMEFMERDGKLFVPRISDDSEMNSYIHRETRQNLAPYLQNYHQPGRRLKLTITTPGMLDTLYFDDDASLLAPLPPDEVEIEVKATSMNFKDVVCLMGSVSNPKDYIGVECAGVVAAVGSNVTSVKVGDRVMAMSEGAYSTFTRCLATSVAKIAADMTFEVASTIPVVFCTAYYGIFDLARMEPGESILIHAAAGGVGQAAISLCQHLGAEIYATVGSSSKKQFLVDTYGISPSRIFYSRDISFGPAVMSATSGRGVDVVLNSLAGDMLRESWNCLAHFGRFIEIGKRDVTNNTRLEMSRFSHNASFSSIDLTIVATEKPRLMERLLCGVAELLEKGVIKPVSPMTVYPISDLELALRTLQSGKSVGKLVVVASPGDQVKVTAVKSREDLFKEDATYIIVGGTGGLGRSIARWSASKGAKHIALISRTGKVAGKVAELVDELALIGTTVFVAGCDVADRSAVEKMILEDMAGMPPVRGVIQAAMVLRDMLFDKMTHDDFEAVVRSKVVGTWNVHHALAHVKLDFFIAFSSVAGIVGNRGQANYAAANTFLDAFVQYRITQGLPATSIDLTAVSDVGYLADNSDRMTEVMQNLGEESLNEAEVLALVAAAVSGKMTSCNHHCITGLKIAPSADYFWIHDAKFVELKTRAAAELAEATDPTVAALLKPLSQQLEGAASREEAVQRLCVALVTKMSTTLMIPEEDMDPSQPMTTYGLDSLVAIEMRNWITREAEANLQVLELLTSASLSALARTIVKKSKLKIVAEVEQTNGAE